MTLSKWFDYGFILFGILLQVICYLFSKMRETVAANNLQDMSLDEINAIIAEVRNEK